MTPQEQQMIDGLIERIRNTQVTDKDPQAEQHIRQGLAGYPDALYVLVQTVLVQEYGLTQAQQRIEQLQQELEQLQQQQPAQQPAQSGSFLSKIFGGGSPQPQPPQGYTNQPPYQPVNNPGYAPPYAAPAYPPPGYAQPVGYPPAGGGFLRGALQTAAGVAAGAMVFQGMESLFHGFGGGGYGYGEGRPGETVVNNYYDDAGQGHHESAADSSFYNPSDDASRENPNDPGASQNFADTTTNDLPADNSEFGDTSSSDLDGNGGFDDGSGFDDSGFDNGGGFDDGGGFGGDNSF